MKLLASFQYGGFIFAHVRVTRRAIDACQNRKERVLSAGLSVHIQSDGFATERPLIIPNYNKLKLKLLKYIYNLLVTGYSS